MFKHLPYLTLLTVFLIGNTVSHAQENCNLKKDSEGIKVYLCETEDSPFKTIKVYFETEGTLQEYASGVLDVNNYKKWQSSILQIKILKQISPKELIYYSEVNAPWPVTNRDLIFHLKLWQEPTTNTLKVTLTQLPTYVPKNEGIIRIPSANSILTVTPISPNRLSVNYILQVDPGGDIPPFIANMFSANTPWNTFNNFRKLLEIKEISANPQLGIKNYTK